MRIVELFSGIGSQAKAFENLKIKHKVLNTCEWDIHAIVAYDLIHNKKGIHKKAKELNKKQLIEILQRLTLSNDGKKPMSFHALKSKNENTLRLIYSSILKTNNLINISELKGEDLPDNIDLLTYSFPCQDLSNVGAFHGYTKGIDRDANNRSGLLWEVERILIERRKGNKDLPKFLLLENVPSLQATRHKKNFEEWQDFLEKLGYYNHVYKLNAFDFGLPQNRERILMISIYTNQNQELNTEINNYFSDNNIETNKIRKRLKIKKLFLSDVLKTDYQNKTYLKEAVECQPNNTSSRRDIWDNNLQITNSKGEILVQRVATLTTKQDRHPNSGNLYMDFSNGKSRYRYLTPRECFILMGFSENDYEKLIDNNIATKTNSMFFTRDNMIRLAGNSIAVNVLEGIFKQIIDIRKKILNFNTKNQA